MKEKLLALLIPAVIVIVATALYFLIPTINAFVASKVTGWKGGLYLLAAGVLLGCYYAFVMGFRGRALGYAIFVIVVTCLCIWLLVNFDTIFEWLRHTIGVWWTILIALVMCAVLWVALKFM